MDLGLCAGLGWVLDCVFGCVFGCVDLTDVVCFVGVGLFMLALVCCFGLVWVCGWFVLLLSVVVVVVVVVCVACVVEFAFFWFFVLLLLGVVGLGDWLGFGGLF